MRRSAPRRARRSWWSPGPAPGSRTGWRSRTGSSSTPSRMPSRETRTRSRRPSRAACSSTRRSCATSRSPARSRSTRCCRSPRRMVRGCWPTPSRGSRCRSRGTAEARGDRSMAQTTAKLPTTITGPSRVADRRTVVGVAAMLVAVALAVSVGDPGRIAWVRTFFVIFGSLLIQALPFVMLGAFAAALVEVFVPIGVFERLGALPGPLQVPAAALAGLAFPICECGSVPVARRLMQRGLMPSAAVTFMLAAPVLNPVVIASTYVAFRGRSTLWTMVGGRFLLGMAVAIAVGWAVGNRSKEQLLKPNPEEEHEHLLELGRPEARWRRFFVHLGNDFLFMGRYLLLGATIAAAIQTFLPTSVLTGVAARPVISVLTMMALAAALSLCSESDAFVAASFVQFGPAAQLGFLVFGPMVDLKLVALYAGTFRRGFARTVVAVSAVATFVGALWVGVAFG